MQILHWMNKHSVIIEKTIIFYFARECCQNLIMRTFKRFYKNSITLNQGYCAGSTAFCIESIYKLSLIADKSPRPISYIKSLLKLQCEMVPFNFYKCVFLSTINFPFRNKQNVDESRDSAFVNMGRLFNDWGSNIFTLNHKCFATFFLLFLSHN
jgi:hypothetical protein